MNHYKSNRGRWASVIKHLETNTVFVTLTQSINFTFPNIFVDYVIPNHNSHSPIFLRWADPDQYFRFWQSQLSFAVHCATTALGISVEQLTDREIPMINAIYRFHAYYHIRRVLFFLQVPLPYEDGFNRYDNNYSKGGFAQMCNEYGADLNALYKFESQSSAWFPPGDKTHWEGWFPQTPYDYAKWIMPRSKGLTEKGLTKLSESIRIYVVILLGSQAESRAGIIGLNASNTTARQVYLQELETQIHRTNNIQSDIAVFEKLLKYARTPVDFVIEPRCYMIPSNMELKMGKIENYNNHIFIAPAGAKKGIMRSNNTPPPPPVTPPPKKPPPVTSSTSEQKVEPTAEQHENEKTALIIVDTALILLGLYLR